MKIIAITGYNKTGKTTLAQRLIRELSKQGKVGTVKHTYQHDLNPKNTDTRRHMDAGATTAIAVSLSGTATFSKNTTLDMALDELADTGTDYAVVEGFKNSLLPKIVLGDLQLPNTLIKIESLTEPVSERTIDELINIICKQPEYHTLNSLIALVKQHPHINQVGAIGSFTGIVRQKTADLETKALEFESYKSLADDKIRQIENDLKNSKGIIDVRIHHKTGWIDSGKDIVYIVAAASHRQQLFFALSRAIERIKTEVPIWKKEYTNNGEFWVEEHE
jgi:molybdopterin synthase catalytic subunit